MLTTVCTPTSGCSRIQASPYCPSAAAYVGVPASGLLTSATALQPTVFTAHLYSPVPLAPHPVATTLSTAVGTSWGESGFVRIVMTDDQFGPCGMYASSQQVVPQFVPGLDNLGKFGLQR